MSIKIRLVFRLEYSQGTNYRELVIGGYSPISSLRNCTRKYWTEDGRIGRSRNQWVSVKSVWFDETRRTYGFERVNRRRFECQGKRTLREEKRWVVTVFHQGVSYKRLTYLLASLKDSGVYGGGVLGTRCDRTETIDSKVLIYMSETKRTQCQESVWRRRIKGGLFTFWDYDRSSNKLELVVLTVKFKTGVHENDNRKDTHTVGERIYRKSLYLGRISK